MGKKFYNHRQVQALLAGEKVDVDAKLKLCLELINKTNFLTVSSCQGYPENGSFPEYGIGTVIAFGGYGLFDWLSQLKSWHCAKYGNGTYAIDSPWTFLAHQHGDTFSEYNFTHCLWSMILDSRADGEEFTPTFVVSFPQQLLPMFEKALMNYNCQKSAALQQQ